MPTKQTSSLWLWNPHLCTMALNSVESVGYSEDAVVWEHDAAAVVFTASPRVNSDALVSVLMVIKLVKLSDGGIHKGKRRLDDVDHAVDRREPG